MWVCPPVQRPAYPTCPGPSCRLSQVSEMAQMGHVWGHPYGLGVVVEGLRGVRGQRRRRSVPSVSAPAAYGELPTKPAGPTAAFAALFGLGGRVGVMGEGNGRRDWVGRGGGGRRARGGRRSSRSGDGVAGDRRDPLDGAWGGAGRDPVPPVRLRRGGPRRCAAAGSGHVVQERARRAGARRRQGGHHRRPAHRQVPQSCSSRTAGSSSRWAGRYVTAGDVGTAVADLDVMHEECRWVTGKSPELGGGGDSGRLTAWGVFQGMRAAAEHLWGEPSLAGRRVGVAGLGKVGGRLVAPPGRGRGHGRDVRPRRRHRRGGARAAPGRRGRGAAPRRSSREPDGRLQPERARRGAERRRRRGAVAARSSAGRRTTSSPTRGSADALAARGILYMPDFLVNAGGVIQVADELRGFDDARAHARATLIFDTAREVLARAAAVRRDPGRGRRPARRGADRRGTVGRPALPWARRCRHPRALGTLVTRTGGAPLRPVHTSPFTGAAPRTRGSSHGTRPSQGQADQGCP